MGVAGGLADYIERGTLALGDTLHMLEMLLVDEQTHALLALVGDDFLGAEGLVADRQTGHVYLATTAFNQLGEAVEVAGRTVVVDTYHGVVVFLDQSAHQVIGALLHLWIGALYGEETEPPPRPMR